MTSSRAHTIAVVLILALTCWLRAWPVAWNPLALDEYGTLWVSGVADASECVRRSLAIQGQTPLYYLLVHGSLQLFGESYLSLRLPSLLASLLVPLLGWIGATRAFGRHAGLAALLLLALHPVLVSQARTARPYSLAAVGTMAAFVGVAAACSTAAPRARLLAWGGAVLAAYSHPVFAPVLAMVPLAALAVPAAERVWTARLVARDGLLAAACVAPAALHTLHLFGRRSELAFEPDLHADEIMLTVFPPAVLAVLVATSLLARTSFPRRAPSPGPSTFALAGAAFIVLIAVALWAIGASISVERYLTLALLSAVLLVARALPRLPPGARAIALALLAAWWALDLQALRGVSGPRYLYTHDTLAAAGAGEGDVVLVQSSYIEGELVVDPARWTADRERFVLGPHTLEPGRDAPLVALEHVVLPYHRPFDDPLMRDYLDSRVTPRLEGRRRFFVIGPRRYCEKVDAWVDERFGGRFRCEHRSDDENIFVVHRYEATNR